MPVNTHLTYLQKHAFCQINIEDSPVESTGIVVVIPAYDEPDILPTLKSLKNCDPPDCATEVIVVVNHPADAGEAVIRRNEKILRDVEEFALEMNSDALRFYGIRMPDLPKKHAGPGLARKIGMDEAVSRFEKAGANDGIIVCFDADSTCDPNYLRAIHSWFEQNPRKQAASLWFEHPLEGELPAANYAGILRYELYLRYYNQALKWAGFPLAYQTLGSSMAVRSSAYQQQGGMNRRKAGEDFYFLHKFSELGQLGNLHTTAVRPSARESHRVPFGTGKAIGDWLREGHEDYPVYHFGIFHEIRSFLQLTDSWYTANSEDRLEMTEKLPEGIRQFLVLEGWPGELEKIVSHTTNEAAFRKRFFRWMNALKMLRLVHHLRDSGHGTMPVYEAAAALLQEQKRPVPQDLPEMLMHFRELEREI